jgi:putative DNA primase/helicase
MVENIPDEIKAYSHWICWGVQMRDGKETKLPYSPHGGMAKADDLSTWGTFEQAQAYLEQHPNFSGLGFVFANDDPFCGIDLDKCRNPETGEIEALAQKIIDDFGSYTEISPSEKGIHIIIKGKKPGDKCRKGNIEIYDKERFFAMTGNVWNEHRNIEDRQEALKKLYESLFIERKEKQVKPRVEVSLDDQALIEKAMNAKNGAKFTALWEGDVSGYPSESEADLALCSMLAFWTGGDPDRIDRLFRQSGLYREKWHREDYRDMTISQAIENTTEFYKKNRIDVINSQSVSVADAQFETTFTEGWLARKFVALHGRDVRYCYLWDKWLIWTGRRWKIDYTGEVHRKAKGVIKSLLKEASETDDDKIRKLLASYAHKADTRSKYSAIIELSKCEVPILPEDMDSDPMLFNCINGTIDLRTGELREHRRDDYITKIAPFEYDPNAEAPRWKRFLDEIFNGNDGIIPFLQRAVGYAMTGEIREQVLLVLYGKGANGKTTFLETLLKIFGDYGKPSEPNLLVVRKHEEHPTGVADLMGARFVSAMEIGEGKRLNESLVKRLTGKDKLSARFMRQDFFDFEPTHKIFMAVNHKPHIRGTDTGIWRRIRLIPFSVEIPEHKQDRQLQEKLLKEAPGILAWAVQGCLAWQEHGLGMTTEIYEATNEYREEMDTIGAFIADCCIEGSGCKVKASELYQCYREWCERSGEHYVSQKEMSFYLGDRGYERKRLMNGYHWFGLGILEKHEPLDPTHERSFIVDKHNEGEGGSDSEKQNMNDHEPFSVSNQKSIDFQCYTENGSSRFINEKNDSPEVNSDKASEGMNDRSSQVVEHNGGLKEKLDEYLKKCPDSWVRMIQNSVKQNRFTSLGIAVEASRRMSNGDSQCAWRLIRQNGG